MENLPKIMETIIKTIDPNDIDMDIIEEFGKMLREGKTVIFPTETVYGLGEIGRASCRERV